MLDDLDHVVWQTVHNGWLPVAAFRFQHDAQFFADEYHRVQPNVRFHVRHAKNPMPLPVRLAR